MTLRLLRHGQSGTTEACDLQAGTWDDVGQQGQFLLDLEFLVKCAPLSGTGSCIYCRSPPYLRELSTLFPWIHFYAYEHAHPVPEYDPLEPSLVCSAPLTVQVEHNRTTSATEFTKDMARVLGERSARERESLLMICHGMDPVRQLALQVLLRPHFALLDLAGTIPADYLDGDIILPIFLAQDRLFACLAVRGHAKGRTYDQDVYRREMGNLSHLFRVFLLGCLTLTFQHLFNV